MKMRSIVVNELHVTNWERYKDYQEQVPATLALFDGQYVSRGEPRAYPRQRSKPTRCGPGVSEPRARVGMVSFAGIPADPGDP